MTNASPHVHIEQRGNLSSISVNASVVVAVLAVLALVIIITLGVLKEYKYIRFNGWRLLHSYDRDKTSSPATRRENSVLVKTRKRKMTPYSRLQAALGPSKLGFSRLRTEETDSEEEFPVFNRV